MKITRKGEAVAIEGTQLTVGEAIPEFSLTNLEEAAVQSGDLVGSPLILSVFPDINTRVCDMQTRQFFKLASTVDNIKILNVSNNSLDELRDWCAVSGLDVEMLSDTDSRFAKDFGIWLPELKRLARAIFVVDAQGTLTYQEIVSEIASEPNYEAAIAAAKQAAH